MSTTSPTTEAPESEFTSRFATELALLESMYPEELHFEHKGSTLSYKRSEHSSSSTKDNNNDNNRPMPRRANLDLRIPDGYPNISSKPEVLRARIADTDFRDIMQTWISTHCASGEEILDAILAHFEGLVTTHDSTTTQAASRDTIFPTNDPQFSTSTTNSPQQQQQQQHHHQQEQQQCTVVVFLHHLLNTNKRKQALSPPSPNVNGITRPGYPGVLVYTGPAGPVQEHVHELKMLNWQAFQVRLEIDEVWAFRHGGGVVEVEGIKDVVADLVDESAREMFLESMKIK